jgi:hypothetical protein
MITSTKRGDNATERSAAQFVRNLCEQGTRKPVLRHDAEIAVGVDFVPDRRGPVGASAALRRSVVDDDDLGVLVCPPRLDVPGGTVGIERPAPMRLPSARWKRAVPGTPARSRYSRPLDRPHFGRLTRVHCNGWKDAGERGCSDAGRNQKPSLG